MCTNSQLLGDITDITLKQEMKFSTIRVVFDMTQGLLLILLLLLLPFLFLEIHRLKCSIQGVKKSLNAGVRGAVEDINIAQRLERRESG